MKKTLLLVVLFSGCAQAPVYQPGSAQAQCEYQAEAAIVGIANPFIAAMRKVELMQLCMRARGGR